MGHSVRESEVFCLQRFVSVCANYGYIDHRCERMQLRHCESFVVMEVSFLCWICHHVRLLNTTIGLDSNYRGIYLVFKIRSLPPITLSKGILLSDKKKNCEHGNVCICNNNGNISKEISMLNIAKI